MTPLTQLGWIEELLHFLDPLLVSFRRIHQPAIQGSLEIIDVPPWLPTGAVPVNSLQIDPTGSPGM
jgi:hypothetical protein